MGVLSAFDLLEFGTDNVPPYLRNLAPPSGSISHVPEDPFVGEIVDDLSDVDETTIELYAKPGAAASFAKAYDYSGGWQNGYTGSVVESLDGGRKIYTYTINPVGGSWPELDTVTIRVVASDTVANGYDDTYSASTVESDSDAPTLEDQSPAPLSNDAPVDTSITFSVRDRGGSGVDSSTLVVTVNSVVAYSGGSEQNGFVVTVWQDSETPELDFVVTLVPPVEFTTGEVVTVEVVCSDLYATPNILDTSYQFGVNTFQPVAVLAYEKILAAYGSIVQLDGRKSYDPTGLPLTFNWEFLADPTVHIPTDSHVNDSLTPFNPLRSNESAVSFIPDLHGSYVVQLTVSNGILTSEPVYSTVIVRSTQVPCGEGLVPDAGWLWTVISNFWDTVPDKMYVEAIWSSVIQLIGTDLVKLWSNDRNKSLATIQNTVHRRWQKFEFTTKLLNEPQRVVAGLTDDNNDGETGIAREQQRTLGTGSSDDPAVDERFSGALYLSPNASVDYTTVVLKKNGDGTYGSGDTVAVTVSATGTISGTGLAGAVNLETGETYLLDTGSNFDDGDTVGFDYEMVYLMAEPPNTDRFFVRDKDFSFLDRQGNAKGRIMIVDGTAHVVDSLGSVGEYGAVTVGSADMTPGEQNLEWRIPHLLNIPTIDMEDFKISTGDLLVMEFTRNDIGVSGELLAQVVGVKGARLGFEFTLEDLTVGGETIDQSQFSQLARDLKLVPQGASDEEAQAAGIALVSYMPVGVNLASRPFTPYRITARANYVRHNSGIRVRSDYVSIPALQEALYQPPVVLRENWDYILGDGEISLEPGLFTLASPSPEVLWAECSMVGNIPAVENNFGRLVEVYNDDLSERGSRVPYISAVKGLWYAITGGATVDNIRLGLQILLGLPYAEVRGRILDITENFSQEAGGAMLWLDRILLDEVDEDNRSTGRRYIYFYPNVVGIEDNLATGEPYAEGDIVERFSPLSKGVEITDYVKDPTWWTRSLAGLEILKYFVAQANIDGNVFDAGDALFAVEFLRKIKPAYVNLASAIFHQFSDDMLTDAEDQLQMEMTLKLYDNAGGGLPTFRADQLAQGVRLWHLDSRPFTLVSPLLLRNVTTSEDTSTVVADSTENWPADIRVRTAPTTTTPFVEGDILAILPGQPGAGGDYAGLYEIGARVSDTRLRLDYVAPSQELDTYLRTALDSPTFQYGSGLTCCVLRRLANPFALAGTLSTSGAVATDVSTDFLTSLVTTDDHLVIETGETDAGEYRVASVAQNTLGVVNLDGSAVTFTGGTDQSYRVIRPRLVYRDVTLSTFEYGGGELTLVAHDPLAPTLVRDVFSPGMVGGTVLVSDATDPANNGNYTIVEYVNPAKVKVTSAAGSAGGTGSASITSRWHPAFERASELVPTESFQATVT